MLSDQEVDQVCDDFVCSLRAMTKMVHQLRLEAAQACRRQTYFEMKVKRLEARLARHAGPRASG